MTQRVAVFGAGIVGLCLAEQLAHGGAIVDLIEREAPGAGATTSSFAWINATFDKQPRSYFELSRDAVECWRRWSEADPKLPVRWVGSVEWADEEGAPDLAHALDRHRRLGASSRALSRKELADLEPEVDACDVEFACATAEEAVVEPEPLVARLVERIQGAGVRLRTRTSLVKSEWQGAWQLSLERDGALENLACDVVVLAAGTATERLARHFGSDVPLVPSPGVLVDVPARSAAPRGVVLSPGVHFRSTSRATLRAGLDFGGMDPGWSDEEVALEIGRRLKGRLEGVEAEALEFFRGERPMPVDGLPVVGRLASAGELFVAVMHSGVTLAPWIAELLSVEVLERRTDPRLADFRPARFA